MSNLTRKLNGVTLAQWDCSSFNCKRLQVHIPIWSEMTDDHYVQVRAGDAASTLGSIEVLHTGTSGPTKWL